MFCFWESYRCCSKTATRAYQNLLARIACHRNSDAHKKSPDISYENKRSFREKCTFLEILQFFRMKAERLENQLLEKEKHLLRIEADTKYGTNQAVQAMKSENQ